jgi:plastocyanin
MDHNRPIVLICALVLVSAVAFSSAVHAEGSTVQIRFENQRFTPQTLTVAAGQPLAITVTNAAKQTIEFESFKLNRERAIAPGETITVHLPALSPGSYDFYDDFHQNVPEGTIVAH